MTPAELAAYRDLCRRWPECCPEGLTDQRYKSWSLGDGDSGPIRDCEAEHIIIGHLETAVLDKYAPGWIYESGDGEAEPQCRGGGDDMEEHWAPSRLSALLAACEDALTAKGNGNV